MMKRTGVACLLFALLAGTLMVPADAAKRKPKKVAREVVTTYGAPWLGTPSTAGGCISASGVGNPCPRFLIYPSERWVTMEVVDASGTPTAFRITQPTGSSPVTVTPMGGLFCGSSGKKPVKLMPGVEVVVRVYAFGDVVCPGALGTTGTVRAVFSNRP